MRVTQLENKDRQPVRVDLVDGTQITLPTNGRLANVDVANIDSIRDRVSVTRDLTEVGTSKGRTPIFG